jgi:DNA-binding ferritin-like protein (Dps family)
MSTETNSNGIVYDLTNTSFKSLIERVSALNFKFEDSKKDILEKLFKKESEKEAEEFINQLLRMATNLTNIANAYKKEIDTKKSADIAASIDQLDADTRQVLINQLVEKGFIPKPVVVEIERTRRVKDNTQKSSRTMTTTIIVIGGTEYEIKTDAKTFIGRSFLGMDENEVKSVFKANGISEDSVNIKGKTDKPKFIAKYEKH